MMTADDWTTFVVFAGALVLVVAINSIRCVQCGSWRPWRCCRPGPAGAVRMATRGSVDVEAVLSHIEAGLGLLDRARGDEPPKLGHVRRLAPGIAMLSVGGNLYQLRLASANEPMPDDPT